MAADTVAAVVATLRAGQRQRLVIGVGHGTCTCEGAAFEYTFDLEHELRMSGVHDLADVVYLTNEYELGDVGAGGMTFDQNGFTTSSRMWTESLLRERGVRAIQQAHVHRVDADCTVKPFDEWTAEDWPRTYQNPLGRNIVGIGIAFAPPHAISRPRKSPRGTVIAPAPPRTGMPSGVMGRMVERNLVDMIQGGAAAPTHSASMGAMGAACNASAGTGLRRGTAAAMTMYPIVPDLRRYPGTGRSSTDTYGEIGLAAHGTEHMLHYLFLYQAKASPGWQLIPR
ncbi:MAG: NAD(P)/FAD-dependent oxidoreductase [Cellulomonas sp.]